MYDKKALLFMLQYSTDEQVKEIFEFARQEYEGRFKTDIGKYKIRNEVINGLYIYLRKNNLIAVDDTLTVEQAISLLIADVKKVIL